MNKNVVTLLNAQIQKEFESAYLYLYFASYFEDNGLDGFSNWFRHQAEEEEEHAMKFYDYLHETNQHVVFFPINLPECKADSVIQILEATLEHEEYITALINTIYSECENARDYRTKKFLEWFISEQLEEETQSHVLITKYSMFGTTPEGLYELNKELGKRE